MAEGQFIDVLTMDSTLAHTTVYSYNVRKTNVEAEQVAFQRTVAVTIGVIWATMLNHLLWPNEARRELTLGLSE